jgi:hypothetical protein
VEAWRRAVYERREARANGITARLDGGAVTASDDVPVSRRATVERDGDRTR